MSRVASEHSLTVARTARYYTLGADSSADDVWFVCHGYAQLAATFVESFRLIADERRLIVAPEGLSRFYIEAATRAGTSRTVGASWMTRDDRLDEIADYVRYLDAVAERVFSSLKRADVRMTALGFSQGVATVCRWLAQREATAEHIVLWGATLPPELPYERGPSVFNGARISLVLGDRDAAIDRATFDDNEATLRANGFPVSRYGFAGGHRLDNDLLRELARRERRRATG
jgi:predicted esterase